MNNATRNGVARVPERDAAMANARSDPSIAAKAPVRPPLDRDASGTDPDGYRSDQRHRNPHLCAAQCPGQPVGQPPSRPRCRPRSPGRPVRRPIDSHGCRAPGSPQGGGAYVPLDPAYPAERLAFMVDDARASVLVAQADLLERLPGTRASVICLDRDRKSIEQERGENLPGARGF